MNKTTDDTTQTTEVERHNGEFTDMIAYKNRLSFVLHEAGRKYINDYNFIDGNDFHNFYEIIEEHRCNSMLEDVRPEEVGALTDTMLLTLTAERDDWNNLVSIGDLYYFAEYQTDSIIETLLETGKVEFSVAPAEDEEPKNHGELHFIEAIAYPYDADGSTVNDRKPARFYVAENYEATGYPYSVFIRLGSNKGCDCIYGEPMELHRCYDFETAAAMAEEASRLYADPRLPQPVPPANDQKGKYGDKCVYHKKLWIGNTTKSLGVGGRVLVDVEITMKNTGLALSMSGEVWMKNNADCESCGQIYDHILEDVVTYKMPVDKVKRIIEVWRQWHLNDMTPGCVHITPEMKSKKLQIKSKTQTAAWTRPDEHPDGILAKPCDECGYKYGTKWLHRPLPQSIIDEIKGW